MKRVEIKIRRLVVHGKERFNAEAFDAEVAQAITQPSAAHSRPREKFVQAMADHVGNTVILELGARGVRLPLMKEMPKPQPKTAMKGSTHGK